MLVDSILYTYIILKAPSKKLLELIKNSEKLQDTKPTYRNQFHFYTLTTNYLKKKQSKQKFHFQNNKKIVKYLGINLTEEVKDFRYTENCNTSMKETEHNTNKWKDFLYSWIGRMDIVKMSILLSK